MTGDTPFDPEAVLKLIHEKLKGSRCTWPNCDQPSGGDYCYHRCLVERNASSALSSTHQSAPWDAYHNRSYEPVETTAKEIYDFFDYVGEGAKPEWVPGGNSVKQDEAREAARRVLRKAGHTPEVTSTDRGTP